MWLCMQLYKQNGAKCSPIIQNLHAIMTFTFIKYKFIVVSQCPVILVVFCDSKLETSRRQSMQVCLVRVTSEFDPAKYALPKCHQKRFDRAIY